MIWIIIELLFPILLIVLPLALYKSNRPFMAKFYLKMTANKSARKFYIQCMLILLLLYHYVYAGEHFGEWGIILSSIPCVVLFSFKRTDKLMRLYSFHEDKKWFAPTALIALVVYAIPHLHTLAITITFFLLANMFYPSSYILYLWNNENIRKELLDGTSKFSDYYY